MKIEEAIIHALDTSKNTEECKSCREEHKQLAEWLQELKQINDILGDDYDLDRLRELVQADREGRCAIFPCKPSGVTIYQLRGKKHARGAGISPRRVSCATVWADGIYALNHQGTEPCKASEFRKTWFLSEEDAKNK